MSKRFLFCNYILDRGGRSIGLWQGGKKLFVVAQDDRGHIWHTAITNFNVVFVAYFSNHKHSFTHRNKRNATELSKEVWRAKDNGVEPSIKWSIVSTAQSYNCGGTTYNLCLAEKLAILSGDRKIMLNKRSKIVNTCRHSKKFKLKSIRLDGSLQFVCFDSFTFAIFLYSFVFVYFPNLPLTRVVNLGPVYTIPGSGFPGILDL